MKEGAVQVKSFAFAVRTPETPHQHHQFNEERNGQLRIDN